MARTASGDAVAFGELYDELAPTVYGTVFRVVRDPTQSEQVTQEVFVELWRQARRFNADGAGVRAWAVMVAHRRSVSHALPTAPRARWQKVAWRRGPLPSANAPTDAMTAGRADGGTAARPQVAAGVTIARFEDLPMHRCR